MIRPTDHFTGQELITVVRHDCYHSNQIPITFVDIASITNATTIAISADIKTFFISIHGERFSHLLKIDGNISSHSRFPPPTFHPNPRHEGAEEKKFIEATIRNTSIRYGLTSRCPNIAVINFPITLPPEKSGERHKFSQGLSPRSVCAPQRNIAEKRRGSCYHLWWNITGPL